MIRGRLAGASVGLLLLAAPAASEVVLSGEAGGGYDSNLNAASRSSEAEGSAFAFASALAGVATAPARVRYELAARWSGVVRAEFADLSANRIGLAAGAFARLDDSLVLTAVPSIGGSFHGDSDRDSLDLSARLGLRWRLGEGVALRPGYSFLHEDARTSEFDRDAHRLSLGLEVDLWPGGYAYAEYALELGEVVRYLDAMGGGGPGGGRGGGSRGHPTDTFDRAQLAVREDATISEVGLALEQELTDWLVVRAGGGYARVAADPDGYDVFFGSVALALRGP